MNKKKKICTISISVISIFALIISLNLFNTKNIDKKLMSDSYSYLSKEAKQYIKNVYEETGEILLTEKNKEDNKPYLNPQYIEYLEMTEDEKDEIELIPDNYIIDYITTDNYTGNNSLPSTYDLRNVNGINYTSTIKDQGETEICWAFASIENAETLIMKENQTESAPNFSVRQMDYATSSDHLASKADWLECSGNCSWTKYQNTSNASRELGKGGNFYTSSVIMSNALTLANETVLPWNEKNDPKLASRVLGTDKALYEVNSSIILSTINADSVDREAINSYVTQVKNNILEYGGPFVGTYSPKSTCGFENVDGTKVIKTDDCVNDSENSNQGHAMQIIGWDDSFLYSYCDAGTKHSSVENGVCSSGEIVEGQGAWIVRNSWGVATEEGNEYKYVYLTYDSTRLSVGFITSLLEMDDKTWDNNYHDNPWINQNIKNGMSSVLTQEKTFNTNNTKNEKIEKIKLFTSSKNGTYNVSISSNGQDYTNIASLISTEVGVYTIDFSNKDVIVGDSFTITITGSNNSYFYNDSMSVFTSNVDNNEYVIAYSSWAYDVNKPLSDDNPLFVNGGDYWNASIKSYLKNIPDNASLSYRITRDEITSIDRGFGDETIETIPESITVLFSGSIYSFSNTFSYKNEIGKTWKFEIVYDNKVVASFPIKFNTKAKITTSTIKLYANNGTDFYYETSAYDLKNSEFNNMTSLQTADFYNEGYYITGWNTKADGTGINYEVTEEIPIYRDISLYAQWSSEKANILVSYECQAGGSCYNINGTMANQIYELDEKITLPVNNYTRNGYVFLSWLVTKSDIGNLAYEEEQFPYSVSTYVTYPVFNNTKLKVSAVWIEDDNYYTIDFDSNGGTGSMLPTNTKKYSYGTNLASNLIKKNSFTKTGYTFIGWNTKADGTGTFYTDGQSISISSNLMLYAQWQEYKYTITFNSNNGTNNTTNQVVGENVTFVLNSNTFTKTGYTFTGWNTKADGTGTFYTDGQSISINSNLMLYAQWQEDWTFKINTYSYDKTNKYIDLIPVDTTVSGFTQNIVLNTDYTVLVDYKTVNNKQVLYTGGRTKIFKNQIQYIELTNIVRGDVNGNGQIDIIDYIRIKKDIMDTEKLNGIYIKAADMNNNNSIDIIDYIRIKKIIMEAN